MADLPSGTVTFLFTDIEGSTALWERDRAAMATAVARHLALLQATTEVHNGVLFKVVGDAVQAAFSIAPDALAAAVTTQQALMTEPWPDPPGPLLVRMALHAGQAEPRNGDYLSAPLNRLSRLLASGHGGQILLSQAVQQLVRDDLPPDVVLRDLGVHRLRDLQEPEVIFQVVAPGLPESFPSLRSLTGHPTNLTAPPTTIIGRETEIAAVLDRIEDGARLVTLTGPGGTGKTRLAQEIAAEALGRFPDGVFFVDLSPVRDGADVLPAIASVLGVREITGEPLQDALARYLAGRRVLLVLDNCEQVLSAAADLSALLATCPRLTMLATSREPLRLRAEQIVGVPPLPVPESADFRDPALLATVPSVALFVARARAGEADIDFTNDDLQAVANICRRLDGLPLAIELAAVRIRLFPPLVLLGRLEQALPVLTGGARDAPERQRTLRQAIAWSYDLLTSDEQSLFRDLGVFVGGCTFAGANAVAAALGDVDVFDGLGSLIDKNLLILDASGFEPRYRMLETIREFALERLRESSDEERVRRAHLAYLDRLSREDDLFDLFVGKTSAFEAPVARLAAEEANFRTALEWALIHDPQMALAVAARLGPYWSTKDRPATELDLLERIAASGAGENTSERAQALAGAAYSAFNLAEYVRAEDLADAAFTLAERLAEPRITAFARYCQGLIAVERGEGERGEMALQDALTRFEALGNTVVATTCLNALGRNAALQGDQLSSLSFAERVLASYERLQDKYGRAIALINLAASHCNLGHLAQAQDFATQALALAEEVGSPYRKAAALSVLYELALDGQGPPRAAVLCQEALGLWWEMGEMWHIAYNLAAAAKILVAGDRPEAAARLHGAAEALREAIASPIGVSEQAEYERERIALSATLGEPSFNHELELGRHRPLAEAVAEALAVLGTIAEGQSPGSTTAQPITSTI